MLVIHTVGQVNYFPNSGWRRNKHDIPLRKLFIFGRSGLPGVRGWVKE